MLTLLLASSACTVRKKETALATLTTPFHAELVRIDRSQLSAVCAGGHGFGLCLPDVRERTNVVIEVAPFGTRHERSMIAAEGCAANEPHAGLDAPAAGTHVAWKCAGRWRVAVLSRTGDAFIDAEPPVEGERVKWSTMPPLSRLAPRLLDGADDRAQRTIYDEVRAQEGHAVLARLLVARAHSAIGGSLNEQNEGGAWAHAYWALDTASQRTVRDGIAAELEQTRGEAAAALLAHALVLGMLDGPAHAVFVAAQLDALLAREGELPEALAGALLTTLTRADVHLAGARGCTVLGRTRPNGTAFGRPLLEPAIRAVAASAVPCRALSEMAVQSACAFALRCGPRDALARAPLCDDAQLSLPAPPPIRYRDLVDTSTAAGYVEDLLLPALRATHAPLPPELLRRNVRRLYTVATATPAPSADCLVAASAPGRRCACTEAAARERACEVDVVTRNVVSEMEGCTVEIDDRDRVIRVRSRAR